MCVFAHLRELKVVAIRQSAHTLGNKQAKEAKEESGCCVIPTTNCPSNNTNQTNTATSKLLSLCIVCSSGEFECVCVCVRVFSNWASEGKSSLSSFPLPPFFFPCFLLSKLFACLRYTIHHGDCSCVPEEAARVWSPMRLLRQKGKGHGDS